MRNTLEAILRTLQGLDIAATRSNVNKMEACYQALESLIKQAEENQHVQIDDAGQPDA